MNRPSTPLFFGLLFAGFCLAATSPQLMLPGAAPAASQGTTTSSKPKTAHKASSGSKTNDAKLAKSAATAGVPSLAGRSLMLNGKSGLLQISGDDNAVTVDKLQLAGACVV